MALKKKQQQALDLLIEGHNTFLSGEAGTGKSYVIECFKDYLNARKKKYVVCAPTGLAALNVGGSTLHRTFGLSIDAMDWKATMSNVEEAEVIIVDEISMCRVDTFRKIAKAMFGWYDEDPTRKKKQLVVVGDFFQLPPVLTDDDAEVLKISQEEAYPFCSEEWNWFNFKSIVLNEVVRQQDEAFASNLNKIRIGNFDGIEWIEKKAKKSKTKKAIHLCSKNKDAKRINDQNLRRIKERAYYYDSVETGDVKAEDRATDAKLVLKEGARVMCLINKGDTIANGMLGTVSELTRDSVEVQFDNGVYHKFDKYKWSVRGFKLEKGKKVSGEVGTFTQIPLKLAWAITIHKSQGQTYSAVNLSPSCFCAGQLYVGLSRCKDVKKMHLLEQIEPSYLMVSDAVKRFYAEIEAQEETIAGIAEGEVFKQQVSFDKLEQVTFEELDLEEIPEKITEAVVEKTPKEEKHAEYIRMEIPKHLEKQVLSLIKGDMGTIANPTEIDSLREQISALQKELEKAKASSKRRPKIDKAVEEEIIRLRKTGLGMNKIAKQVKCGDGTVRRVLKDYGIA